MSEDSFPQNLMHGIMRKNQSTKEQHYSPKKTSFRYRKIETYNP